MLQLTDNEDDDCEAVINNNGQVAWVGSCLGAYKEIWLYDGTDSLQLTDDYNLDYYPQINDSGVVVWMKWPGALRRDIWFYDGTDVLPLTDNGIEDILGGLNNSGHIVWSQESDDSFEIQLYNGTDTIPLTNNSYSDSSPRINNGGDICWNAWTPDAEIMLYDGSSTIPITDNDYDDIDQQINNNRQVTWMGGACPFECEIFFDNGTDTLQLTDNSYDDRDPRISENGNVVWWGLYGGTYRTFLFDGTRTFQLAENAQYPDINTSGHVVWQERNGSDWDIFYYDGTRSIPLTADCSFDDTEPKINDRGDVVWQRHDGTDTEIMLAIAGNVPEAQWAKVFGGIYPDHAKVVRPTADGGYIVAGDTQSFGAVSKDVWVLKLDSAGNVQWQKTYGGDGPDSASSILQVDNGGYLVAGNTQSFGAGLSDIWVLRLDAAGTVDWQRVYGGPENEWVSAIEVASDCGYILAGRTDSFGTVGGDLWLLKLDTDGNLAWEKAYGGPNLEHSTSLQRTRDGGYVVAGTTNSFGPGNGDFWVLKLDVDGNVQWEKAYGLKTFVPPDIYNQNSEFDTRVQQTENDGYIVAGVSYPSPDGRPHVWTLKLDAAGIVQWQKIYTTTGANTQIATVLPTSDLGYLLSGKSGSFDLLDPQTYGWLMKIDVSGNTLWKKRYSGLEHDALAAVSRAADGGYIAAGTTDSFSISDDALWVLKLDAYGDIPDCPAIGSQVTTAEDTTETGVDSSATVTDTVAAVSDTNATVEATEAFQEDGCHLSVDLIDLPQTGQTAVYYTGDDGDVRAGIPWPSLRFIDNGNGTLTDYLTGLIWLKDADCLGTATWEDALDNVADFNQNPESYSCTDYDTENLQNDWRAPNINEIESLVNAQVDNNAIWLNAQGFVDVTPVWHWSSSTPTTTYRRWTINMEVGQTSRSYGTGWPFPMWPVRGGQKDYWDPNYPANVWKTGQTVSFYPGDDGDLQMGVNWPSNRFQDNGDGTVTDNLTGLLWLKDTYCFETPTSLGGMSWENALVTVGDFNENPGDYNCTDYDVANHIGGWRVPNKKELFSLLAWSNAVPALPEGHPFLDVDNRPYWSSTTYPNDPQSPSAWTTYPGGPGGLSAFLKEHTQPTVWPVRGGLANPCEGDFNGDRDVDGSDLAVFAADFGRTDCASGPPCEGDFDNDTDVDGSDLAVFAADFGRTDCLTP